MCEFHFLTALHRWTGSGYLPVSQTKAPQPKGQAEGARQGSLRQAIMYAYNNKCEMCCAQSCLTLQPHALQNE